MAFLKCPFTPPEGFPKKVYPLGCEVEIMVGICSCADLCKNTVCPFYDMTDEATDVFTWAQMYNNTMTGLANPRIADIDEVIYRLLLEVYNLPKEVTGRDRTD